MLVVMQLETEAVKAADSTSVSRTTMHTDYYNKIQAFVPNDTINYTYFHLKPAGVITDSLRPGTSEDWIIVTIDTLVNNWFKLKDVFFSFLLRGSQLQNVWVPVGVLYTSLPDPIRTFTVHVGPNKDATTVVYPTVWGFSLVDIKGQWMKIKFMVAGEEHVGWKHKFNLCCLPWTICTYPDAKEFE